MFFWGASLFFEHARAPADAADIYVVGKQWMWKLQHPEGRREINELHVPVGRPFRLILTSEDAIHSFYIPAFRDQAGRGSRPIHQRVVSGHENRRVSLVLRGILRHQPLAHDRLGVRDGPGRVRSVVERRRYGGVDGAGRRAAVPEVGLRQLPLHLDGSGRGPSFAGLFGKQVLLEDKRKLTADEAYLRTCILTPSKNRVAGYPPIMPTFQGQISEENLLQILAYIKSLAQGER